MNAEMLMPFCDKYNARMFLRSPFVCGHHIAVCDGNVMVCLPLETSGADTPDVPAKVAALIESCRAASLLQGEWVRVDSITLSARKCSHCAGAGSVTVVPCDECDGEGYFDHGIHEYECKSCDGHGEHSAPSGEKPCSQCRATGLLPYPSGFRLMIDGERHSASSVYIAMLRNLPNAELCAGLLDGGVIAVRFDGGFGALMPMRNNGAA